MKYKVSHDVIAASTLSLSISSQILNLPGQRVKRVQHDLDRQRLTISCARDRLFRVIDPSSGKPPATVNHHQHRTIRDLPLCVFVCYLEIELTQVVSPTAGRLMVSADFVDKGSRYTVRFGQLVSGLCRHMSINTVAWHY